MSVWWNGSGDAAALWTVIRGLKADHASQIRHDRINRRIYSSRIGQETVSRSAEAATALAKVAGFVPADLNFTRPIVDALHARVGNNRPAVKHAADGASWTQRRKARQLDKVIEGSTEQLKIRPKAALCLRESLVVRGGALEIMGANGKIVTDRVPCEELLFDFEEARYGEPRQMHRLMSVSKDVLKARFPGHADAIDNAKPSSEPLMEGRSSSSRRNSMVEVAKSWHLPSKDGGSDGLFVISIDATILHHAPWKRDRYPIAFMKGSAPAEGFWPASLVDDLANLQYQVNSLFRRMQENAHHCASVKIQTRRGAEIQKSHLVGLKPHHYEVENPGDAIWHVPEPFPPSYLQFLEFQIRQMHEVSGVSQLMTQSKNPLGAGASGAALAEFYDIESERFSHLEQGYADFWVDISQLIIDAARDLADDDEFKKSEVKWSKQNVLHRIKWEDVDLEEDQYELHLEASGFLPNTRAGKMQAIEQLIAAGFLDPKWAMSLLDFPDLKQAQMVQNSPIETALWAVEEVCDVELTEDESAVDEKKSAPMPAPDPNWDLDLNMAIAKAVYQQKVREKVPPPVRDRLLAWIDTIDAAIKSAQSGAPAPAPMPMGMAPPGAPPMDPAMAGAAPPVDPAMAMMPAGAV